MRNSLPDSGISEFHPDLTGIFLESLLGERGLSMATHGAYQKDLEEWRKFLKQKPLEKAGRQDIQNYLAMLSEKNRHPKTLARHLSTLRQFYKFLRAEGYMQEDPTQLVLSPKIPLSLPSVLSEEEMERLLQHAQADTTPDGIRLWAFLELLYATGLRVSELVTLPLAAFASQQDPEDPLSGRVLYVKGKGGRERLIPLVPKAILAVKAYLKLRLQFIPQGSLKREQKYYLFPSWGKEHHFTRQRVGQLLKELAIKAGISPEKVSPHALRHAFATHLLHHGADLVSVQRLLGHADISTTQIYTHVLKEHLRELVLHYHPLTRFPETDDAELLTTPSFDQSETHKSQK
jgi:integrase/recombinase XerD